MTLRIAITGHRGLPTAVEQQIDRELRDALGGIGEQVVGLSCIADGADSLFARAVLDTGGELEVVVPAAEYREGLPAEHWPLYDSLYAAAARVHEMAFVESTGASHQAASERMLEMAEEVWAVWDGLPARGYGGTADVVAAARERGMPVRVFWPDGATR
ncbi:hypothetical protein [Spongiactinospora sp. 9N601]|uniref:hypothetical protein n=1 Tax=Spongiactinospora sp. 9N601 TaxID=3375149 RepID=UPI0037A5BC1D